MKFALKIAVRFLKEGKSQTIFILIGIAIGVAVQIFLSALISGLQADLINKTVGDAPHIIIEAAEPSFTSALSASTYIVEAVPDTGVVADKLTNWQNTLDAIDGTEGISSASPLINSAAFANKGEKNLPVIIKGINQERGNSIYHISDRVTLGKVDLQGNNILLGKDLAEELRLVVGDSVRLITSDGNEDRFYITGIFDFQNVSTNSSWIFMDINRAQKFLDLQGYITSIEVQVKDVFAAESIAQDMEGDYPDLSFQTWQEANAQLLTALKSQSSSSSVIQFFVLMAVALGISSVLAVSVMQKSKQIGILKAMGTENATTTKIFLLQGGLLGLFGALLGSGIGVLMVTLFVKFTSTDGIPQFPVEISGGSILFSVSVATVVGLIASFIPALNSSRLNPIEVIRNG